MNAEPREYKTLSSLSIRRPVGTLCVTSVIVVLGVFYLGRLPLDLLPQIVYPQVRASVNYPGVAPEVMEEQVTKVLETALATTENVVRIETETQEGRASVDLHFSYGTDVNFALQDASKNIDRARARLPRDADAPTIFKFDPSQSPVFEVGFSSSTRGLVDLRNWIEQRLRPQLLTIEGVASVDVAGGLVREIRVTLDQERLRSYGLAVADVLTALRDENQDVAVGSVQSPTYEVGGKAEGKFKTVDDVRSVLLEARASGRRIPLAEVAAVADTNREQRLWGRLDGIPAVRVSIRKQPDANTVGVTEQLQAKLEELAATRFIPSDVQHTVLFNQAFFINGALHSVREAAVLGAGLAMLMVLLFMGSLRKTFIIGLSIPLAVLATFVIMGMGNLTLNIMSLGGLTLGVGMLVDNAIVMIENIFRHAKLSGDIPKKRPTRARRGDERGGGVDHDAPRGGGAVPADHRPGGADLPRAGADDLVCDRRQFGHRADAGADDVGAAGQSAALQRHRAVRADPRIPGRDRARDGVYRAPSPGRCGAGGWCSASRVRHAVRGRPLTRNLGSEFLPTVDDGNVGVNLNLAPGTSALRTNEVANRLEALVRDMPYVRHVFTTAGGGFFGSGTTETAGRGSLDILLVGARERRDMPASRWVSVLQARIDSLAIPGARISVRGPRIRGLRTNISGADVAVKIQGENLDTLGLIGREVMARLGGIRGLEGLQPSTEAASPQLAIRIDRQRASDLGLSVAAVGQTVRTALDGAIPTRFTDGANEYDLRVRLPRESFNSAEDVGSVALFAGRDRPVYLRDVADVKLGTGPTSIRRENQNRLLRITGDVNDELANVSAVMTEVRARLADLSIPDGYGVLYGGEEEAIRENSRNLMIVTILAVFLVFVVMAVQYESFTNPLVIIVSVPLSLVGVALALWLTSTPLSAPVLLGVILLAGIVTNNAILLVEYVELARERGVPVEQAVVEAGAVRLRPIVMTTLTTTLGMSPLALGLGEGSELMQPLAIAVIGGLSISTLLTLLVIPCSYLVIKGAAERLRGWVLGTKGGEAAVPTAAD